MSSLVKTTIACFKFCVLIAGCSLCHAASSNKLAGTEVWVSIGPTASANDLAGRVACIAVDPANTNHWYVGGAVGGVWETLNAGDDWRPLTDDQASLAMGALAIAPSDPKVIYA